MKHCQFKYLTKRVPGEPARCGSSDPTVWPVGFANPTGADEGCLSDNKFLQVLEGEPRTLNGLYEKIMHDPRHLNTMLLSYTPIHERHFTEWSMRGIDAALLTSEHREALIKKYGRSGDGIAIPEATYLAHSLLFDLYHLV